MLTEQEKEYIRLYYPVRYSQKISEDLGIEKSVINNFAKSEGLKKVKKNTYIIQGKKLCGKCNKWVDLEGFHKSNNLKKHPSGYQDWCIECYKQYVKENKEKFNIYKERNKSKSSKMESKEIEEKKRETLSVEYTCKWCGEIKKGSEFSFKSKQFKRDNVCKHCRNERAKENKINKIKLEIEE